MLFGAKITDVLIAVQPPVTEATEYWARLRDYYLGYEALLLRLFKRVDLFFDTESEEFMAAAAQLGELDERARTAQDDLVAIWTTRIRLYTAMRQVVQRRLDPFDVYEDIFVFTARLDTFNARRGIGVEFLQAIMRESVQERLVLIERLYIPESDTADDDFAAMKKLDRTLSAYMKMYDSEDVVRVAYSAMERTLRDTRQEDDWPAAQPTEREKQVVVIGQLLEDVRVALSAETASLEASLRVRALLRQVAPLVGLLAVTPRVVYRNERLEFAESGWPVTSDAPLKVGRIDRALMEQQQTAQWDMQAGEYITSSQRLIALVPDAADLDSVVRADLRGPLVSGLFDRFRLGDGGNCVVRRVLIETRAFQVLVTTRVVRSGEPLARAYTDAELYKIWLSHNETVQPVGLATGREYRARKYIGELQLSRIQLMSEVDSEENKLAELDYRIRIDLLSSLLLNQ